MRARPYQVHAIDQILASWDAGLAAVLAVLATGLGKTVIAAHVIRARLPLGRAVFLAHREELIWQAADKIHRVAGVHPAVEMAEYRAADAGLYAPQVIVSTVQTQYSGRGGRGRMTDVDPRTVATLVVDEAHHYVSPAFRKVIDYYLQNPLLKVLGITATPDRADRVAMGKIFQACAVEYGIRDGIEDGWLCPVDQTMFTVDGLDLSNVHTKGVDLSPVELAAVMEREGVLHGVAAPTMEVLGDRRALVFAASVKHAETLAEIFNRWRPGCARWVCGTTPRDVRKQMFADYAAGRFQVLCNVGVATEGFDDPGVEVVIMARPTASRSLYAQMIGRATRPLPGIVDSYDDAADRRCAIAESAKPACEVIDFVGNAGRHKLVSVADVLGGNYDDDVVAHARKKAEAAAGKPLDMLEALAESMAELHERRERERAAEAARRAELRVKAKYTRQAVDPFDVLAIEPPQQMGWDKGRPLTDKQLNFLEKQGIETDGLSAAAGRQLLNEIFRRFDANECSFKQAKLLKRYGLDPNASRDQAKQWLDAIAGNNWKLPPDLAPARPPVEVF